MDKFLRFTAKAVLILLVATGGFICLLMAGTTMWELYHNGLAFSCNVRSGIAGIVLGSGFIIVPLLLRKLLNPPAFTKDIALYRVTPFFFILMYVYVLINSGGMLCEHKPKAPAISDHS